MYNIYDIGVSEHNKRYEEAEAYKYEGGTENEKVG